MLYLEYFYQFTLVSDSAFSWETETVALNQSWMIIRPAQDAQSANQWLMKRCVYTIWGS